MSEPWAWERRRALLLDELREGDRWLDLGAGSGRFLEVAPNGVGVDLEARGAILAMVGGQIPLEHGSVDLIWCSEVVEHVPDALGLLQECRRVLRPGGRLLVTTPGHPWWRRLDARHFDPLGEHVRFFTRRSLGSALRFAGFDARVRGHAWLVARAVRA